VFASIVSCAVATCEHSAFLAMPSARIRCPRDARSHPGWGVSSSKYEDMNFTFCSSFLHCCGIACICLGLLTPTFRICIGLITNYINEILHFENLSKYICTHVRDFYVHVVCQYGAVSQNKFHSCEPCPSSYHHQAEDGPVYVQLHDCI